MSKKANRTERVFPATTSILAELRDFVSHEGARFGLDKLALHNLALAIDEAATNIIEHVLPRRSSKISCACSDTPNHKEVIYEISWESEEPYHPDPVPSSREVRRRVEERTPGGLGVYLIHALVDEIEYDYRNGKCIIRLIKHKKK
jgi:anti-sigma regulatory factor (Ser/Thr protein kinase)